MHKSIITLALTVLALVTITVFASPASLDPQTLIGEWAGEWSMPGGPSNKIYLTIKKVEGQNIVCSIFIQGRLRYHNRDLPCSGNFDGSKLTISVPDAPATIDLTLVGKDHFRGDGIGQNRVNITLDKKTK